MDMDWGYWSMQSVSVLEDCDVVEMVRITRAQYDLLEDIAKKYSKAIPFLLVHGWFDDDDNEDDGNG
jgi:hypothetical protein